jgi:probable phosphoglycerate mutase
LRLLLMRHGQTHANVSGALDTAIPGEHLTDLGHAQARAAARALADRPVTALYVSPLRRTHQTAAPLVAAYGVEPEEIEGLREISAGDFEMGSDHDSIAGYITTVAAWIEGRLDTRMPGGETGHEFLARYDDAVAEIHRSVTAVGHERALLVSHGAAIRTWVSARVPDVEAHAKATDPLHNTACITLVGDPERGWEVDAWSSDPVGGTFLDDAAAPDPTGQATDVREPDQAQN